MIREAFGASLNTAHLSPIWKTDNEGANIFWKILNTKIYKATNQEEVDKAIEKQKNNINFDDKSGKR